MAGALGRAADGASDGASDGVEGVEGPGHRSRPRPSRPRHSRPVSARSGPAARREGEPRETGQKERRRGPKGYRLSGQGQAPTHGLIPTITPLVSVIRHFPSGSSPTDALLADAPITPQAAPRGIARAALDADPVTGGDGGTASARVFLDAGCTAAIADHLARWSGVTADDAVAASAGSPRKPPSRSSTPATAAQGRAATPNGKTDSGRGAPATHRRSAQARSSRRRRAPRCRPAGDRQAG